MIWKTLKDTSEVYQGNWRKRIPQSGWQEQQTLITVPEAAIEVTGKLIALNGHMRKDNLQSIMSVHLNHQKRSKQITFIKLKYKMQIRNP